MDVETLVEELETKFPMHGVMYVLGILYPQYWLQAYCETFFTKHLAVIKIVFYSSKTQMLDGVKTFVHEVLNANTLIDSKVCSS